VLSQVAENGEVVSSAPGGVPSNCNCTPATPTLSEAEAATDTDPDTVAASAGAVSDTAGGVVSAFATVTLTLAAVAVFPAASRATAVRTWTPSATVVVFHEIEYGAVVSSAPSGVPSSLNWTPTTPTLSEASAATVTVPPTVALFAGLVTETVGGVVSGVLTTGVFMSAWICAAVSAVL